MAGGPLGLAISQALQAASDDIYLIGVDGSKYHAHLAVTDEIHIVPRAGEPDYIDVLGKSGRGDACRLYLADA